ncbi:MAG: hypothetical protein AAFV51_07850 [Pseudomonadota bacterium]
MTTKSIIASFAAFAAAAFAPAFAQERPVDLAEPAGLMTPQMMRQQLLADAATRVAFSDDALHAEAPEFAPSADEIAFLVDSQVRSHLAPLIGSDGGLIFLAEADPR